MTGLWTNTAPEERLSVKPFYIALAPLPHVIARHGASVVNRFPNPEIVPFMFATTADELVGTYEKRLRIIEALDADQTTLAISNHASCGLTYFKIIQIVDDGAALYDFGSLRWAEEACLRQIHEEKGHLYDNKNAVLLDYPARSGQDRVLLPLSAHGLCVWERKTGEVINLEKARVRAPSAPLLHNLGRCLRDAARSLNGLNAG